jgi:hypothetical protein
MSYELFHNKATKFSSPQLTIRNGRIAFNAAAGDLLTSVGMRFAHLLLDTDECKVAIRPIQKEDENAFAVSIPKGKRGGTISAQSFLNYIRWHADEPIVVDATWCAAKQLMEAFLPKEHVGFQPRASVTTGTKTALEERRPRRRLI